MNFKYIDESLQSEWENLVKNNSATGFMQSFFWTKFTNLLGWTTFKIGIFEDEKLIGGAIITKFSSKAGNYLYIPQGPVIPYELDSKEMFDGIIAEIDKIADLKGETLTSHLRIEPKLKQIPAFYGRFQKAPTNPEPLRTLMIDLNLPEEEILKQMKPKGRYNIKLAERHGIKVTSTSLQSSLADFLKFYQQTVERKQFTAQDDSYFTKLVESIPSETEAKFYFAKDADQILAVALVIFYGNEVTFLFGASSNENREKMAPYLLHWEIIKESRKKGYRRYDFYGIAPDENDLEHPWQGFTTFKKKFGGTQVDYIGAYDFIYNEKLYQEYLKED